MKTVVAEEMPEKHECLGSHSSLYLPECLVIKIFLLLPAKSVGRFRCVSTAWLSISTDPSFIISHTRRIPKSLVLPFIPLNLLHTNELFNLSIGLDTRGLRQITDVPLSSCDGLVSFRGFNSDGPCANYVLNPLTGLRIDFPSPSAKPYETNSWIRQLYYHRPTGEYRILNVHDGPKYAEVLSLGSAIDSWRRIDAAHPVSAWALREKCLVLNDCLYWLYEKYFPPHFILIIFDVLEEAFSCMDLPFDVRGCRNNYGLVDIEGKLGFWMASRDNSEGIDGYQINIWVEAEGDEKWGSPYSLQLGDEWRRLIYPSTYATDQQLGDESEKCSLFSAEGKLCFLLMAVIYYICFTGILSLVITQQNNYLINPSRVLIEFLYTERLSQQLRNMFSDTIGLPAPSNYVK